MLAASVDGDHPTMGLAGNLLQRGGNDLVVVPHSVQADINNSNLSPPGSVPDDARPEMVAWDDWSNLRLNFRQSPYYRLNYAE